MSLFATHKMKHATLQRISFLQSMPQQVMQFVLARSIAQASEYVAKQNFAKPLVLMALLSPTSGPALAKPAADVARPSWARLIKSSKRFADTKPWASKPSFSRATRIGMKPNALQNLFCRTSITDPCKKPSTVAP